MRKCFNPAFVSAFALLLASTAWPAFAQEPQSPPAEGSEASAGGGGLFFESVDVDVVNVEVFV
ncbi:MAG: hypothetical protein KDD47_07070, partial [Acidobacteria bacterium]|nr:hypothetical protein [Acidobacteriota bacterium]